MPSSITITFVPENLKSLAARSGGRLAEIIGGNLAEELDAAAPHPVLWRHFAESLGVSDAALDRSRPLPGVAALLDTYDEAASQSSVAQAVGCFYAYEAQVPEISTQKIAGLRRYYGITDSRALEYFAVHEEADLRHRAAWRDWLASEKDADSFGVLCAAERSLKALGARSTRSIRAPTRPETSDTRNVIPGAHNDSGISVRVIRSVRCPTGSRESVFSLPLGSQPALRTQIPETFRARPTRPRGPGGARSLWASPWVQRRTQ